MRIEELRAIPGREQVNFVDRTGAPVRFADLLPQDEAMGRRLAACWNACFGVRTDGLEAGAVTVVSVDLLRSIYYLLGKIADQDALTSYDRRRATELVEELGNVLSRLQQNWEQSAETRITVTIDVQTWQGYHDRRVIEVEPGIGWPERMAPEVLKAALEMEEQFLRRGLQQNGGEGR